MSNDTTKRTAVPTLDEKQAAYQSYMDAFRRAQQNPTLENATTSLRAYEYYLEVCELYTQGEAALDKYSVKRGRS